LGSDRLTISPWRISDRTQFPVIYSKQLLQFASSTLVRAKKDVNRLRFIKDEHSGVKELIKRIAAASGTRSQLLEEFAKHDPSINLRGLLRRLGPGS
jgi:hypothetical protein